MNICEHGSWLYIFMMSQLQGSYDLLTTNVNLHTQLSTPHTSMIMTVNLYIMIHFVNFYIMNESVYHPFFLFKWLNMLLFLNKLVNLYFLFCLPTFMFYPHCQPLSSNVDCQPIPLDSVSLWFAILLYSKKDWAWPYLL